MNYVNLPGTDLRISQAVFGSSRLGGTVERYDKGEAMRILAEAVDSGISTFDTADIYAQGNSEKLLGEALRSRRDEVVIATKGGYVCSNKLRILARLKPIVRRFIKRKGGMAKMASKVRGSQVAQNFSPDYLTKMVEASLRRLKTDRIDIYQLHSPKRAILEQGEVFQTLQKLKVAGKIRSYGASLLSWDDLPLCYGHGVSFVQVEADLLGGGERTASLRAAAVDGIVPVARQPFQSGLLAKASAEWAESDFGGDATRLSEARERVEAIRKVGDPFEVIIRYLVHHSEIPAFLFGTTREVHLKGNLEAMSLPEFSAEERDLIGGALQMG